MPDAIKEELEHYETIREDLELNHFGEWVVVHDSAHEIHATFDDAADSAVTKYGRGPYLIRQVGEPQVTPTPASLLFPA